MYYDMQMMDVGRNNIFKLSLLHTLNFYTNCVLFYASI